MTTQGELRARDLGHQMIDTCQMSEHFRRTGRFGTDTPELWGDIEPTWDRGPRCGQPCVASATGPWMCADCLRQDAARSARYAGEE